MNEYSPLFAHFTMHAAPSGSQSQHAPEWGIIIQMRRWGNDSESCSGFGVLHLESGGVKRFSHCVMTVTRGSLKTFICHLHSPQETEPIGLRDLHSGFETYTV